MNDSQNHRVLYIYIYVCDTLSCSQMVGYGIGFPTLVGHVLPWHGALRPRNGEVLSVLASFHTLISCQEQILIDKMCMIHIIHIYIYIHMHVFNIKVFVCVYLYTCIYIYTYICIFICIYICICMCIYIYICIYICTSCTNQTLQWRIPELNGGF